MHEIEITFFEKLGNVATRSIWKAIVIANYAFRYRS